MGLHYDEPCRITHPSRRTLRRPRRSHRRSSSRPWKKNRQSPRQLRPINCRTRSRSNQNQRINQLRQRWHCPHHRIHRKRTLSTRSFFRIRNRQLINLHRQHPIIHRWPNLFESFSKIKIQRNHHRTRRSLSRRWRSQRSIIPIRRRNLFIISKKSQKIFGKSSIKSKKKYPLFHDQSLIGIICWRIRWQRSRIKSTRFIIWSCQQLEQLHC